VCVILVTFITTNLVTLVATIVWRIHPAIVFAVWLPFVTLDALYLSSALTKVPSGAWFTILLAIILATFFTLWRYGKEKQWASEAKNRPKLSSLIHKSVEGETHLALADRYGGGELTGIDGMGIFFDKGGMLVPMVYEHWLRKFRAQMDVIVLLHLRALSVPYVSDEERYAVSRTSIPDVYRLTIRHGYNDHVITPEIGRLVYEEVRKAIICGGVRSAGAESPPSDNAVPQSYNTALRLRRLDMAYETQALYLVGKEQMRISANYNVLKRIILGVFLWVRENCRGRVAKLNVPVDKLVEVGFVCDI
jgi:KUP system potassium uptake protein